MVVKGNAEVIICSCEDCSLCGIVFPHIYWKKTLITTVICKIFEEGDVRQDQVGGI